MTKTKTTDSFARYWKLSYPKIDRDTMLQRIQEAGYDNPLGNARKEKLVPFMQRIDRCLPCYHICANDELERFCRDRRICIFPQAKKQTGKKKRQAMIDVLFEADKGLSFNRFLDLPPELRNEVYELSMTSYPEELNTPTHPPLARTCKLVRNEVLPMFYHSHRFQLIYSRPHSAPFDTPFGAHVETCAFLHAVPPECVGAIEKLKLMFYTEDKKCLTDSILCRVDVEGAGDVKITVTHLEFDSQERREALEEVVNANLSVEVRKVAAREGKKKLRLTDLHVMHRAVQEVYDAARRRER